MSRALRPVLRFAPSPNGRLHLGHAFSALLNEAMARRMGGRLLLRIEDIDPVRSRPDLVAGIFADLDWLGITFEMPVRRQSEHMAEYRGALDGLAARGLGYPCFCSRGQIAAEVSARGGAIARDPDGSPLYPGTCRALPPGEAARRRAAGEPHSWRLDMGRALDEAPGPHRYVACDPECPVHRPSPFPPPHPEVLRSSLEGALQIPSRSLEASFEAADAAPQDEILGRSRTYRPDSQDEVEGGMNGTAHGAESLFAADPSRWGDPIIARRDVPTSYHLAVVLDDAVQDVTYVVRGADLEAATGFHVLLQRLFGCPTPAYHHHALVLGADGAKLAKSKGSESLADLRARGVTPGEVRARLGFA